MVLADRRRARHFETGRREDRRAEPAGEAAIGLLRRFLELEAVDDRRGGGLGETDCAIVAGEVLLDHRRGIGPELHPAAREIAAKLDAQAAAQRAVAK